MLSQSYLVNTEIPQSHSRNCNQNNQHYRRGLTTARRQLFSEAAQKTGGRKLGISHRWHGSFQLQRCPAVIAGATNSSNQPVNGEDQQAQTAEVMDQTEDAVNEVVADMAEYSATPQAAAAEEQAAQYTADAVVLQTPPQTAMDKARELYNVPAVRFGVVGVLALLVGSYCYSFVKVYTSSKAKRRRTVNKNKTVVEDVNELLMKGTEQVTPGALQSIRNKTGFSAVEVFRKYLWFLLRERKFDHAAVQDMVTLRAALGLTDQEVAEALRERAQRLYAKYGNIMLETEGMTKAGIERKATLRALFSKLLYLQECDALLPQEERKAADVAGVFGATEEDVGKLRIVSLYEVDLGRLEDMPTTSEGMD